MIFENILFNTNFVFKVLKVNFLPFFPIQMDLCSEKGLMQ